MTRNRQTSVNARQIKAARALLDWSQEKLAEACNLSIATIRKIESGNISPRASTMGGIQRALEGAGLEFITPNGVRQRPEEIITYEGEIGTRDFFDDVYNVANKSGGDIVVICRDANTIFTDVLKDYRQVHIDRMSALKDKTSVKVILTESKTSTPGSAYAEYRYLSQGLVNSLPFYVYGDKSAFRLFKCDVSPKLIVIQSLELAETLRHQFYSLWDKAVPVSVPECKIPAGKKSRR